MSAALPPSTRSASGTRMRAVLPTDLRKDLAPKSAPLCSRPLPPPLPPPRAGASPSSVPPRVASIGQARVDAVRVAVFPTREPGKSVVVTLPPGAATPPGATIAMLVPGDFR